MKCVSSKLSLLNQESLLSVPWEKTCICFSKREPSGFRGKVLQKALIILQTNWKFHFCQRPEKHTPTQLSTRIPKWLIQSPWKKTGGHKSTVYLCVSSLFLSSRSLLISKPRMGRIQGQIKSVQKCFSVSHLLFNQANMNYKFLKRRPVP